MNNLKLAVDVVRAHNLLPKDGQGSSNAAVELIFDGQKFRTTIKEKDLNPFWNETFYFNVSNPLDLHNLTLEAHLYSINKSTSKKHSLGKLRINGTSFVPYSDSVVFNYPLEKNGLFSTTRGELALKVYLTGDQTNSYSSLNLHDPSSSSSSSLHSIHDQSPPHRHGEAVSDRQPNGRTRSRRKFNTLSGSDHPQQQHQHQHQHQQQQQQQQQRAFSSSMPSSSYQTAQYGGGEMRLEPQADLALKETRPFLGGGRPVRPRSVYDLVEPMQFLFVRVVKARDLPTKDITGSLDPYVEVKLGNYKGVTRHFEKTKSPEWNTVFTFSKDRMQSNVLEVVVMDKDVIKDDFVGVVRFDLLEIPKRVPPDSPLAPEWHRLDNNKGETRHGELMLAVWIGTQADEAFADAWHSDEASLVDSSLPPSTHVRSKVYLSPRMWYVRVNVIEVQDLVVPDRNRFPIVHVKAQIGNQVLKTRSVQSQTMNASWNEDLMFVAAEPFDDHLVVSVDDRVGPNKDEALGKVFVSLITVEKRADDRVVHSKWFNLQKPNATDHRVEEDNRDHHQFASRIHLRICLDGGYHVFDESTQYSSDLRPTAKQLWKPPVGVLEVGILNADALTPMKTRNGRGTSDTFCVAKYGQKWIRTRTITDSLNPKFNEQYTWDVFDPATVLTVGVFDNGRLSDRGAVTPYGNRDMKIGKVRIRISTLETDRVYTHSYPLIVLHPSGVKKMGELHLAIRFTCNSMFNMMALYSRPLLPKMHYIRPLSVGQLDMLRYQAVSILAARLSRAEPPLKKEVIEYMSDANSHLWSMRRSKANFYRLMAVFNGVFAVSKWLNEVCQWKNPVTTVLVYALFIMLVVFPELILPTLYLYMFLIGLWNYRFRPRNPPHMNMRLSCADAVTADELDEEFDTFPTARNADTLRTRYDRLRSVAGRIQRVVGDVAAQGERVQALLSWRDPRATVIFMALCIASAVVFYAVPLQLMIAAAGSYAMRHPRFRHKLPAAPVNFFRRLPARTDSML